MFESSISGRSVRKLLRLIERNLEAQKEMKKILEESLRSIDKGDRLSLLLSAQLACMYIEQNLYELEKWLQSSQIMSLMPKELLKKFSEEILKIAEELIEFDIKHTSEYRDYMYKLLREDKLPKIFLTSFTRPGEERREERRIPYLV